MTQEQSPEDQAALQLAAQDEAQAAEEAAMTYLRGRAVNLNLEVRRRDARIAELEETVAELTLRLAELEDGPDVEPFRGTEDGPDAEV